MACAKRHHYVPAAYLARFGESEYVLVPRSNEPKMYETNVKKAAVESGFYEILDVDGQPSDASARELSSLESAALSPLTKVEQNERLPPVGSAARSTLATFLAVQFTWTPLNRERIMFPERVAQ